jgi:2-polyprenyl-6-methoxyphenol hydroxylase-like FAD-dependent oxidoreductase
MPTSHIIILERAPEPRLGGQAVDLRSSCLPIVKRMGILEKVKEKTTTEVGMQFVYRDGQRRATFEATGEEERQSGMSLLWPLAFQGNEETLSSRDEPWDLIPSQQQASTKSFEETWHASSTNSQYLTQT